MKFTEKIKKNLLNLMESHSKLQNIKPYFVSDKCMRRFDYKSLISYDDYSMLPKELKKDGENFNENTETLGVFIPESGGRIYLCPERIKKSAKKHKIIYDEFMKFVYIHEFAHYYMSCEINFNQKIIKGGAIYSIIEESLANVYALKILQHRVSSFKNICNFVRGQSVEYSFALKLLNYDLLDIRLAMAGWRVIKCTNTDGDGFERGFLHADITVDEIAKAYKEFLYEKGGKNGKY